MVWFLLHSKNLQLNIPSECDDFSRASDYRMYFIECNHGEMVRFSNSVATLFAQLFHSEAYEKFFK